MPSTSRQRMNDSFQEWVEMQGRPAHKAPDSVEYLQSFNAHLMELHNAQAMEDELDLYAGLKTKDVLIPVSVDSQNQAHAGPPESRSATILGRIYTPTPDTGPCPLVVYFRGEVVAGDLSTEDTACRQLAKLGRYVVLNVNYRNAPGHAYPTPLQDCWDVTKWVGLLGARRHCAVSDRERPHRHLPVG